MRCLLLLGSACALLFFVGCEKVSVLDLSGDTVVHEQEAGVDRPTSGEETIVDVSILGSREDHPYSIGSFVQQRFTGTGLTIEATLARTSAYTRYRVSYLSNGLRISGIMNVPVGTGPFPLIVLNHGYIDPAVYTNGRGLKREQDRLARHGYVVIHTDYRNHAFSDNDENLITFPAFRNFFYGADAINAVLAAQVSDLSYIDTDHVGMLGHSMGGGVTMQALVSRPKLVDAAVLYAPVHSQEYYNFHRRGISRLDAIQREELSGQIGSLDEVATFAPFSPQTYFDRIEVPVLIHQGGADEDVDPEWSRSTARALSGAGAGVTLYEYENEPHEFVNQRSVMMERTVAFFDSYLK